MSDSKSSRRRKYSSSSESSVDSAENERRKDLQERDAFATRLRQKDEGKTRKVLEVKKKKNFHFKRTRIQFLTEVQLNRFQIKGALKKQQSDSNLSWKTGNPSFQIYVFNLVEHIWKSERKIKLPNWKPIFWMMNICLMNQCK